MANISRKNLLILPQASVQDKMTFQIYNKLSCRLVIVLYCFNSAGKVRTQISLGFNTSIVYF